MGKKLLIEKLLPGEANLVITKKDFSSTLLENASAGATSSANAGVSRRIMENDASVTGSRHYFLRGKFLQGEVRNRNGRIYPRSEIEKAVRDMKTRIQKTGPVPGELDHPETTSISFDRLAIGVTDIWMEGNDGVGEIVVLSGGKGLIVEAAIEAGIRVGVSSRGLGEVDSRDRVYDYEIVTIDVVLEPSAPDAYPEPVLEHAKRHKEGKEVERLLNEDVNDPSVRRHLDRALNDLFKAMRDEVLWRRK